MTRGDALYNQFIAILKEELRPAMGCTEPIALAYAGAKAKEILGKLPTRIDVFVSGKCEKNVLKFNPFKFDGDTSYEVEEFKAKRVAASCQ